MSKKHIYIIYTGGTVGMEKTAQGYHTSTGFLTQKMQASSEFHHDDMPEFTLHEFDPLLDSSDMNPQAWLAIANTIADNYDVYDGFIIVHGTDTMAYTASALSFMLQNLAKPVILTGSQVPLCEVHTDARENLLAAMLLAADDSIAEVCIYFNNLLLRGNRSHKVDSKRAHAFGSPNCLALAEVGTEIKVYRELLLPKSKDAFHVLPIETQPIACLSLFPGFDFQLFEKMLAQPLKALVLISFGAGNAPIHNDNFMRIIKKALDQNIAIINTTQCLAGGVNMQTYYNGRVLADVGVVSAHDMTLEATLCKMQFLLTHEPQQLKQKLGMNLRGELTEG